MNNTHVLDLFRRQKPELNFLDSAQWRTRVRKVEIGHDCSCEDAILGLLPLLLYRSHAEMFLCCGRLEAQGYSVATVKQSISLVVANAAGS